MNAYFRSGDNDVENSLRWEDQDEGAVGGRGTKYVFLIKFGSFVIERIR